MRRVKVILFSLILLIFIGCQKGKTDMRNDLTELKNFPQEKLDKLASKKIFFGHQSVGFNIIDGIKDVIAEYPAIKINVVETKNPLAFDKPIFAHSQIGINKDLISKIDDFKRIMESGVGEKVDIAFFKFCYVDIREYVDIDKTFKYYVDTISYLQSKYPNVKFLHFTLPLTITPGGIKTTIKRIIGYPLWTDAANIKRNQFNRLILENFGKDVFDLAGYESTFPDGKREFFIKNKQRIFSLVSSYASDDDGHLNKWGAKIIAKQFLLFLINNN